jgi:MoaA/NifB/PqqE/SkfB family radical SAM enzyme
MFLSADNARYALGIVSRKKTFIGPNTLDVAVTNACNFNCTGCYFHSHLTPARAPVEWHTTKMEKSDFRAVIDEACSIKVRNVTILGEGEPFMHPDILDLVAYVKQKGLGCAVLTNGSLLTLPMFDALTKIGLDELIISFWDSNKERYTELHPGHEQVFVRLEELLANRLTSNRSIPGVQLIYMLSNKNFSQLQELYDFALRYRVDRVTFKLFRVYADSTSDFIMTTEQINSVIRQLRNIDSQAQSHMSTNSSAFADLLGHIYNKGSMYHNDFLRARPCFVGWYYAKVSVYGDVTPCCGCPEAIMGNIFERSFHEIWNSATYTTFRSHALSAKNTEMFPACACDDLCPFYQTNLQFGRIFAPFL